MAGLSEDKGVDLFRPADFEAHTRLLGWSVLHVPASPCPLGERGCEVCRSRGWHYRPPQPLEFSARVLHRPVGVPEALPHHWVTEVLEVRQGAAAFPPEALAVVGGRVEWLAPEAQRPPPQSYYVVRYRALPEWPVHIASAKAHAEYRQWGLIEDGDLLASIPAEASPGVRNPLWDLAYQDRLVPVAATVRDAVVIAAPAGDPLLRWVKQVVRAFRIAGSPPAEQEVDVDYDPAQRQFVASGVGVGERVTVVYDAAPEFVAYRDLGMFRAAMGLDFPKLVSLKRAEAYRHAPAY